MIKLLTRSLSWEIFLSKLKLYLDVSKELKNPEMNVSRRLIQSEFLLDNLAQQKFTDYGMGTIPLDTTIIDRIKTLIKNKG